MTIKIDFSRHSDIKPKIFKSKRFAYEWIMEGLFACEGAERDHYVDMLDQFNRGEKVLFY